MHRYVNKWNCIVARFFVIINIPLTLTPFICIDTYIQDNVENLIEMRATILAHGQEKKLYLIGYKIEERLFFVSCADGRN